MADRKMSREQRRKELEKQKKAKKPAKGIFKKIVTLIVAVCLLLFIGGAVLFTVYASSAPELDEKSLKDPISSIVLDKNGDRFAVIGAENRKYIPYEEIPQTMEDAILATEDVRFYNHMGIDLFRLGGAVLANFTQGFGSQGASTITQQVIKNSFLKNEKTLKRKAQEAYLAIQLEREYEKEEIFEMYFNKVLMSGNRYGFGTAAEYFYGKELNELELQEMALLAGMPQSPNNYNPFKNPERAEKRRNIVLSLMHQHGKISEEEMKAAQAIPVTEGLKPEDQRKMDSDNKYEAFLDVVLEELRVQGDEQLLAEGITIHTTLDPKAQQTVENQLANYDFPTETLETGIAVIDTKTGGIAAIGGGRNYIFQNWNYAQDLKDRQPGSTIKPLLDYGPAIEYLSWSTGQTVTDEPYKYKGTDQTIRNADGKYKGDIPLRQALYESRNVPSIKVFEEVGTKRAGQFIKKLGIDVGDLNSAVAIGGSEKGISPIQMAASYAAFGNKGVYTKPYSITKISYRDGQTEKTYKSEPVVAMKDSTAYMVTDMLRDVINHPNGSGRRAAVPGVDVAGKTGTTNYTKKEFEEYNLKSGSVPDSWFSGYTTDYSISIWSGYKDKKNAMTTWDERRVPQYLFRNIMGEISEGTASFKKPSSVVEATVEVGTNPLKLASDYTPDELKRTELFVKGTEPKEVSEEYDIVEVGAPINLQADYNPEDQSALLSWDHESPDEDLQIGFVVSVTIDGAESKVLSTQQEKQLKVDGIQPGSNYTFSVVAFVDEVQSSPATVSLRISASPEDEGDKGNDKGNGNGQGNGNGNGNGQGNGNGNGETQPPPDGSETPPEDGGAGEEPPPEEGTPPPDDGGGDDSGTGTTSGSSIGTPESDGTGETPPTNP
ncbi:PBP1A family penicillin-binding protein [Chungangia koreensis]|uniref:PBP1A family penicillin-binding protein n=1 Tax=Chungangia koreensis TaxID=752657 RepID=A0ABV8X7F2_9LACT